MNVTRNTHAQILAVLRADDQDGEIEIVIGSDLGESRIGVQVHGQAVI